jgi:hypothetical protein
MGRTLAIVGSSGIFLALELVVTKGFGGSSIMMMMVKSGYLERVMGFLDRCFRRREKGCRRTFG